MTWKAALLGGAVGLIFFAMAYGLAAVLYPGKIGLGMGDVTLATFIGLAVGFPSALVAVVLGVLLGGLFSALLLVTRRVTLQTRDSLRAVPDPRRTDRHVLGTGDRRVVAGDVMRKRKT